MVAAHPDDECIGLGGLLPRLHGVAIVHVTDGAPRQRTWWGAPELSTRTAYARARRAELLRALALAGVDEACVRSLDLPDQEASLDLAGVAARMADVLGELRPEVVLTHPCEGGHPDHDAAAFAVHAARRILRRRGQPAPRVLEFTSYHAHPDGGLEVGAFLPAANVRAVEIVLTEAERDRKRCMLAAFATQRETLARFPVAVERYRAAPAYDFTAPPHAGALHYERHDWGCTGAEWRARAGEALRALGAVAEAAC